MRPRVVVTPAAAQASGRHLPLLVALAALGAGLLAFVIGMQVGQKREEHVAQAKSEKESTLSRLDRQARRLRTLRQRQELSFHDTLAGPVPTVKVARVAHKPKVAPKEVVQEGAVQEKVMQKETAPNEATSETRDGAADDAPPHYALQVGAFPEKGAAQGLAQRLQSKGYATHIASASVDGKGVWYRVRVGRYGDRGQAESARSSLSDQEGLFALVVPEG